MGERLETWAPRTADALRSVPQLTRAVLLERCRLWVAEARRGAPVDRGDLARSIDGTVTDDDRIAVSMPAQYAAVESGGTIRPRRGQWLAVPIAPAAELLPGPRSDVADLFVVTLRDGRRFLASKSGGGIEMRWKLERETRIRGRGFMASAMTRAESGFADALLDRLTAEVA